MEGEADGREADGRGSRMEGSNLFLYPDVFADYHPLLASLHSLRWVMTLAA